MKPNTSPTELEQLVARIHRLIEPEGTSVVWNNKIRDPDTGRLRQIDGTIEREGKRTLIECRDHIEAQDVKWVEELIGRRLSLDADGMIGVSISGFTAPAVKKAAKFGIILRTLAEMSDAEIRAWGKLAQLDANYVEISELEITAFIRAADLGLVSATPELRLQDISPIFLIVQPLVQQPSVSFFTDRNSLLSGEIRIPPLMIDGASVIKAAVRLVGRLRRERAEVTGVWNYRGLETPHLSEATVSKHGGGNEIVQHGNTASMILDLSTLKPPPNCFLNTFQVDFGRIATANIAPIALPHTISFTIDTTLDVKAVA